MNAFTTLLFISGTIGLLIHPAANARENIDQSLDVFTIHKSPREGFLDRTRQPSRPAGRYDPLYDRVCIAAKYSRIRLDCAPTLKGHTEKRNFQPPQFIAADLPHLRLDIVLRRMENKVVSDGGVAQDPEDFFDLLSATWKIQSAAAADSIPDPMDDGYSLPAPNPGEIWDVPHANFIYQGIITNGCSETTIFDVELISSIAKNSVTLEEVQLQDEVIGNGYYTFLYTIRAADPDGGVSDFVFSGDANAYCTAQNSL